MATATQSQMATGNFRDPKQHPATQDVTSRLIELVTTREYNDLKKALLTGECGPVDVLDKNGMIPLQHAAYKGDVKACQLLIDHVSI